MAKKTKNELKTRTVKGKNGRPVCEYQEPITGEWGTSAYWAQQLGLGSVNSFQSRLRRYREGGSLSQLFEISASVDPSTLKKVGTANASMKGSVQLSEVEESVTNQLNELPDLESYMKLTSEQFQAELQTQARAFKEAKRKLDMLMRSPQFAHQTSSFLVSVVEDSFRTIKGDIKAAAQGYKPVVVWVSPEGKVYSLAELYENYITSGAGTPSATTNADAPVVTAVPIPSLLGEEDYYEGDDEDDDDEDDDETDY